MQYVFRCLLWLPLVVVGCGDPSDLDRIPLTGTVSRADGPVTAGNLTLTPVDKAAPAANAAIVDGKYAFTEENGPVSAQYHAIVRTVVTKADLPQTAKKTRGRGKRQKTKWEFDMHVPDEAPYIHDFTLQE